MAQKVSAEVQNEAMRIAKATQKAGQTKEQTKLISQGIEKGIAEYKKQQKVKARTRDKQKKQEIKAQHKAAALDDGLALDTLDLSGKMFTGGVPTNFETTNLSRFSPLADQIYTTSQTVSYTHLTLPTKRIV